MENRVSKAIASAVAKKASAKKATAKKVKEGKGASVAPKGVYAKMVRPSGEVRLSNGERTSCGVGRSGPVVKVGDGFVKINGVWELIK